MRRRWLRQVLPEAGQRSKMFISTTWAAMLTAAIVTTACVTALPGAGLAAPIRFTLEPGPVVISFRAYGLGLLPIEGQFTRFHGTLTLDDQDPAACTLAVQADAASLAMPSQAMTQDAQSPDLLDVARYPDFRIEGTCSAGKLTANLLLHGVDKPIAMGVAITARTWQATGLMRRAEWGMGARPLLAGPEVRITVRAGLPRGFGRTS